jgi:enoyl-CoA hydratase/carnithine racemase
MSETAQTRLAVADGVAIVTLARPARLNAYTPDMGDELVAAFRHLATDPAVGAVVVTGAGRAFCAGADRDHLAGQPGRNGLRLGEEAFLTGFAAELLAFAKPVIAAVNGPAVGIGATMLLTMDLRLCAPSARFDFPFARLGLIPGMGATCLLPALVGEGHARRILLTGAAVGAEEAVALGLAAAVVPDEALLDHAVALARSLLAGRPAALAACKRLLNRRLADALAAAIDDERRATARLATP